MHLKTKDISISGNIALYPSLTINPDGIIAVAWYEYSSPFEIAKSDIWFSVLEKNNLWSEPINLSQGISFNNGPSLIWINSIQSWYCAWHSWRPPGKEPFVEGGDITNIWYSKISKDLEVTNPNRVFEKVTNTEYASLAYDHDKDLIRLLFNNREQKKQLIAKTQDKNFFNQEIKSFSNDIGKGKHGDIDIDIDGVLWIVFIGSDGNIYLSSKSRSCSWIKPIKITNIDSNKITRPKISICSEKNLWITFHTDNWGSRTKKYKLEKTNRQLQINISTDKSPGNHCWAINTIMIRGKNIERFFNLGPKFNKENKEEISVDDSNCIYSKSKGYGFKNKPRSQLREIGNNYTRSLFYDDKPGVFLVDIPNGIYEVEIQISSWIAPVDGVEISFNADLKESSYFNKIYDEVRLLKVNSEMRVESFLISNQEEYDQNRPSKLMHYKNCDEKYLTWTSYGPDNINVVFASFNEKELIKDNENL